MIETECEVKKWGNSLGIVIPREAADKIQLKAEQRIRVLIEKPKATKAREIFGTFKLKKPTEKLMAEIDRVLDM